MTDEPPDEIHGSARYEWERIVRRVVMPGPTKCVAFALATYANADGTSIFPGNERLSAVTCQADKTIRRALAWLRAGYLIERVREGSRGGRGGFADEYRLTIPSDLLARHMLLDPDESPVTQTGDKPSAAPDHRPHRPVPPVSQSGSPVSQSQNTGPTDRTPTHHHPLNQPLTNVELTFGTQPTTGGGVRDDKNLLAELIKIDELAARRRGA